MKTNLSVAKSEDSINHLSGLMTLLHITHVPVVLDSRVYLLIYSLRQQIVISSL